MSVEIFAKTKPLKCRCGCSQFLIRYQMVMGPPGGPSSQIWISCKHCGSEHSVEHSGPIDRHQFPHRTFSSHKEVSEYFLKEIHGDAHDFPTKPVQ